MILSVVIPIGNLGRDIENLKSIVSAVPKQEVELVLILTHGVDIIAGSTNQH